MNIVAHIPKAQYLYTGLLDNGREDLIENIKSILDANGITYEFETPQYWTSSDGYKCLNNGYIDHSNGLNEFLTIFMTKIN